MPITPRKIKDPTTATNHWKDGTANAAPRWLDGFLNPRQSPKAAALASNAAWKAGVSRASAADLYHKGVSGIDENEMAQHAVDVGMTAYQNGTQARVAKFGRKIAKVIAAEGPLIDKVRAMPNATIAERAARAAFWITEMAKLRGTF